MTYGSLLPLLIVTPLRIEARALRAVIAELPAAVTLLECLDATGEAAADVFAPLLRRHKPGAVLLAGFAGSLDPTLTTGSLVLAAEHHYGEGRITSSEALLNLADRAARHRGIPHRTGALLTAAEEMSAPAAREAAHAATRAHGVEMEGYWLGMVAAAAGIPFLGVRAISDGPGDIIPPYVAAAATGGTWQQLRRVAPGVLRRPSDIRAIARLAANARMASRNLGQFTKAFLDELV